MYFRSVLLVLSVALLSVAGTGCQKNESLSPSAPPTVLSPDTIASVHWFGKKRVGITAGAYYFSRIWQQPQSAQLERQTLIKLASTPGQWLPGGTNLNVDACSRLWWLLGDIVQEESYLEIRQPTNGTEAVVFAIRLNEAQAGQWITNLPVVLEPLIGAQSGVSPDENGWMLGTGNTQKFFQLVRVDQWTLVSFGPRQNPLQAEIIARIRRDGVPFVSSGTNLWLEASLKIPRIAAVFPLPSLVSNNLEHLNFSLSGDGANVITRARLTVSKPLPAIAEPWHLPVDLMHEPLTSLTAVRGLQTWLAEMPMMRDLQMDSLPDQLAVWSLAGNPYQTYLAVPMNHTEVASLTDHLLHQVNPWLVAHGYVSFDRASDGNGVTWGNQPDIKPFIKSAGSADDGWLYAGLFPDTNANTLPPPVGLIQDILRRTNAVYYDWEVTGPRLQPTLEIAQTTRLITRCPQLALSSASLTWLGALIPRLGTSATIVNRTGPDELTFYRRSTLGLTALELHWLTGWLESPQFPHGLPPFTPFAN